jgi:signal transduction protein with GAF and PtsI domain
VTEPAKPPEQVELLRSVVVLGRTLFGSAACSIALLNEDESHLTYVAASGVGADQIVGVQLPINRGIAGWVVSSGQPIGIADVQRDARFERAVAESTGYVPRAILAVPIEGSTGDPLGVIQVLDSATSAGRDDMALLGLLSTHAQLCIEMAAAAANLYDRAAGITETTDVDAVIAELRTRRGEQQDAAAQMLSLFLAHTRR